MLRWNIGWKAFRALFLAWPWTPLATLAGPTGLQCGFAVFLLLKKDLSDSSFPSSSNARLIVSPKTLGSVTQSQNFLFKSIYSSFLSHTLEHVPCRAQGWCWLSLAQVAHREEERVHGAVRAGLPHPGDLLLQVQQAGGQDREGGRPLLQQPDQAQHEGEVHWRLQRGRMALLGLDWGKGCSVAWRICSLHRSTLGCFGC